MPIVKTLIVAKAGKPRYEVTVDWEHGDADLTTNAKHSVMGECEQTLLEWLATFKECRDAINAARWYSAPFSREEWEEKLGGMELEYDKVYDSCSNPPAMSINKIVFLDATGSKYAVTGY